MKTNSKTTALVAGGVAAALSVLNNVAEASVISFDSGLTSSSAGGYVSFDPVSGDTGSGSLPFSLNFSCNTTFGSSSSASDFTYAEVLGAENDLSHLSLGDSVSSAGTFTGWGSLYDLQAADSYYAGFRFQTTDETDYNYGFCIFSIDDPTADDSYITLKSVYYESDVGVAIEVIPEPATMATLLGGALGLMMMRRFKNYSLFGS